MSKIFFSYSRKDSDFVDQLIEELESYGVDVWVDTGDILAGIATWRQQIVEAIMDCEVFVIALSPNSVTSENVAKELTLAEQHNKRVLPLVIQEVTIPPSLDYQLAGLHYQTFAEGSYDDNFERLTRSLVAMGVESAKQLLKNLSEEPTIPQAKPPTDAQDQKAHDKADIDVVDDIEPNAAQKTETDKKATLMSIPAKPAEEEPAALRTDQRKLSRRTIVIGAIASLLALTGIIVVAVFLTKDQPSSINSDGMVNIPAGNYTISTNTPVKLTDFWIDRYEITNSDYEKFLTEMRNNPPDYWTNGEIPAGQRNHPVRQITWDQAEEYCAWAGKRLPNENEWEVAARGPFGWLHPWGNDSDKVKQETKSTRPVDSNPANRSYFGVYYMSGNVWEWVSNPNTPTAEDEHVLRGGAYGPRDVLTTAISVVDDGQSIEKAGFRCAASAENVVNQYDDNLAIDDDFESSNTNWPGLHEEKFLFDYHEDGFYHLEARESNKFIPAFYEYESFNNFVVETGVFVDEANTDNQQGIFLYGLGIQISDDQFYAFVISAKDQTWQVLKGTLNTDTWIGDASELEIIKSGKDSSIRGATEEQEDRLTVITNNTEFMYYVNGNLVYVISVEDHQKVQVGFIVKTLEDVTKVHIHFNWVTLQTIEAFDNGGLIQKPTTIPATPTDTPPFVLPSVTPTPIIEQLSAATPTPTPTPTVVQPSATPTFTPYPARISDDFGVPMVIVPSGAFIMGTDSADALKECQKVNPRLNCQAFYFGDEEPVRSISLDYDYYIDQYEVTNERYDECVAAGACDLPWNFEITPGSQYFRNAKYNQYPVVNVTWDAANDYCEWRGGKLPTEVEWEKAARGSADTRLYPWGNTLEATGANFCDTNCRNSWANRDFDDGYRYTSPVGEFSSGASLYGAEDMAGNVSEWVVDIYGPYPGGEADVDSENFGKERVRRGGSWYSLGSDTRVSRRDKNLADPHLEDPNSELGKIGFRCIVELP